MKAGSQQRYEKIIDPEIINRRCETLMNAASNWLWLPEWCAADKDIPVLVLFRHAFSPLGEPTSAVLRVSADTRYKLFVNGEMAEMGPSRGDGQIWFYDELDLTRMLRRGENVIAVQVLRYPREHRKGNHGMFRTEYPGLYVDGKVLDRNGLEYPLDGGAGWVCRKDSGFQVISEDAFFAPLQIYESVRGDRTLAGWMLPGYVEGEWVPARRYPHMSGAVSPGNLQPRTIPFLYRKKRRFEGVVTIRSGSAAREAWENLLKADRPISFPAEARNAVEITAGEEMTAYLRLRFVGGAGARIRILQSEAYVRDEPVDGISRKGRRDDWETGHLEGFSDQYVVAGYGNAEHPESYEPFWFRTFRFIRLEIETGAEPLTLCGLDYVETGYPLNVQSHGKTSDSRLDHIWEISERTLRRCMHETYEDCPFYEQLQYAMDSRTEILYTYAVSADDRLARKCMDDFRRSQRYDGLLNCSYPCYGPNVIPGFSIYYILMLEDHMMYFGDRQLLSAHLRTVEGILDFFHDNLAPEGYVGRLGGLNGRADKWSFIDWTPEWDETTGVPTAILNGPITMESLLYVMGLQAAGRIAAYVGRTELVKLWKRWAEAVQSALRKYMTGKDGLLRDGPQVEAYSQHVQVFALLTDTVELAQGRENLLKTMIEQDLYAQCSVAMSFYLFRALQKAGLYSWTERKWDIWMKMIANGATTCVEDDVRQRSDCHAWGALILYELPAIILGVGPAEPGYRSILVRPEPGYLKAAEGSVITPRGMVHVRWEKHGTPVLRCKGPEGIPLVIDTSALQEEV